MRNQTGQNTDINEKRLSENIWEIDNARHDNNPWRCTKTAASDLKSGKNSISDYSASGSAIAMLNQLDCNNKVIKIINHLYNLW